MIDQTSPLSIRRQCALLSLDRSYVYYQPKARQDDTNLLNRISEIYRQWPHYGYRKICFLLREEGVQITRKKVFELMRSMGIKSLAPCPNTSVASKTDPPFPYLLKGLNIHKPNQVWAVDITYIRLPTGMVYLFALIDWHSRYVVGWTLANTMNAEHAIYTLQKALQYGMPEICNADQGSQFTSDAWKNELSINGILISHDGVGRCIDNIRIERLWRTIKYEDIHLRHYENMVEAREGIGRFIEHYNNERPHQALNYLRPRDVYFMKEEQAA